MAGRYIPIARRLPILLIFLLMTVTARTAALVDENNSAAGYGDGPSTAAWVALCISATALSLILPTEKRWLVGNTENDGAVDFIAGAQFDLPNRCFKQIQRLGMQSNNDFTARCRLKTGERSRRNSLMHRRRYVARTIRKTATV